MKIRYLLIFAVLIVFSFSGCVDPKRLASLENRVAAMEMENNRQLTEHEENRNHLINSTLKSIEKKIKSGHILTKEEYARFKYDIRALKKEIQVLEGAIEEIKHKFKEYTQGDREAIAKRFERLDNAISRNYEKVINLEKYMGFEPSASSSFPDKAPPANEGQVKNPEQELYAFAKKLFDDGDKANARIQFENFINKYPDSQNADNARFWIADSYYAEKWFGKAILEYQKVLEEYPKSNKLAAARLKQGYAFAELGEKANARITLKRLIELHPDSKEAQYAKERLKVLTE